MSLARFTDYLHSRKPVSRDGIVALVHILAGIAWWIFATKKDLGAWTYIGLFLVVPSIVQSVISFLENLRQKHFQKKHPFKHRVQQVIDQLNDFAEKRTLEERIHPAVGAALEDLTKRYFDIKEAIANDDWRSRHSSARWQELSAKAGDALEGAMDEAILACERKFRRLGERKKEWAKEVQKDPDAADVVVHLHQIRTGMEELASALGLSHGKSSSLTPDGEGLSRLENTLAHLTEMRIAEQELEDGYERA
jgi:hypothetical protein